MDGQVFTSWHDGEVIGRLDISPDRRPSYRPGETITADVRTPSDVGRRVLAWEPERTNEARRCVSVASSLSPGDYRFVLSRYFRSFVSWRASCRLSRSEVWFGSESGAEVAEQTIAGLKFFRRRLGSRRCHYFVGVDMVVAILANVMSITRARRQTGMV